MITAKEALQLYRDAPKQCAELDGHPVLLKINAKIEESSRDGLRTLIYTEAGMSTISYCEGVKWDPGLFLAIVESLRGRGFKVKWSGDRAGDRVSTVTW